MVSARDADIAAMFVGCEFFFVRQCCLCRLEKKTKNTKTDCSFLLLLGEILLKVIVPSARVNCYSETAAGLCE